LEECTEILRQRRAEIDPGAAARLREAEFGGVEEIAVQRDQRDFSDAELRGCTVERVTNHGVEKSGEMHADLVRAAGVELHFEERSGVDAGEDAPVGAGFASVAENDAAAGGHAGATIGIAGDGEVNGAAIFFQEALHESDVRFLDFASAEGFAELCVSGVIFGDEDDAGGVFIEAMHYAGAEGVATLGESLAAAEESVDQGAARGAGAGVHGHSGGFVDGDDVGVFIEDVERNGFGFGAQRRARLNLDLNALASAEAVGTLGSPGVDED